MNDPESPSSLKCDQCGAANRPENKFCKKCGASLSTLEVCPQCGNKLEADAIFCPQCRTQIKEQKGISTPLTVRRLPLGLEILIVFGALGAAYYFFSGVMAFYASSTVFGGYSEVSGMITAVGMIWLLAAIFLAIVSWGLWNLKEWARKALMINAVLALIGAFFSIVPGLLGLIYSIIILWYISRPHVKTLFQVGRISPIETPASRIYTVKQVCPSCGKKTKFGAKFCVKCGAKLKEVEE